MPEQPKTLEQLEKEHAVACEARGKAYGSARRAWERRKKEIQREQAERPALPTATAVKVAQQGLERARKVAREKTAASEAQMQADIKAAKASHTERVKPMLLEVDRAKSELKAAVQAHEVAEERHRAELRAAYNRERDSFLDTPELRRLSEEAEAKRLAWLEVYQAQRKQPAAGAVGRNA
jgi:hypothetical protein